MMLKQNCFVGVGFWFVKASATGSFFFFSFFNCWTEHQRAGSGISCCTTVMSSFSQVIKMLSLV